MDASASLWNALNYERRQNFFAGKNVWDTADHQNGAGETDSEHFVDLELRGHDSIASSE